MKGETGNDGGLGPVEATNAHDVNCRRIDQNDGGKKGGWRKHYQPN